MIFSPFPLRRADVNNIGKLGQRPLGQRRTLLGQVSRGEQKTTMRSVAITCVKNEIDIVEAFVRHTLALVDHLVVLDNGSHDGTLDVLQALAKEGLPLEIVEDDSPGQYQPQRMTRLMHEYAVARHAADWVFPLDGDEFLAVGDRSALIPEGAGTDRPLLVTLAHVRPGQRRQSL